MPRAKPFTLSAAALQGLFFLQKYRFLTIPQFATAADFSVDHAGELLRTLASRGLVGFLGFVPLPGQGRTPKVYFLKRKGFEYLQLESEGTADLGAFQEVNPELSWSPQMSHRIALLDLFLALERAVRARPSLVLVRTFLEYRRLPGTSTRETADYVAPEETADNRIVPDGAFVLENLASGRRGLFFVEMDRGTERIAVSRGSRDPRATITGKFLQYDRYLTSGRFAQSYAPFGQFGFAIVLLVTVGAERIENIRQASADLPERLHPYYRLGRFPEVLRDFLGPVWKSRSAADPAAYALVADAS